MKLNKIILRNASKFSVVLKNWAEERGYEIEEQDEKVESPEEGIDGLVIFTQNQILEKEVLEVRNAFDHQQKPVHKIDINGTLMVGISNLDLWIERNKSKRVLFIGADNLLENMNLVRFLEHLK
ncbi:MAG: hypothetical protein RIT43_2153 [Bacteroidota bacterium]|jgi:hypothetical protein